MTTTTRLVNLTPHAICLQTSTGERVTLPPPPKGEEARVSTSPGPALAGYDCLVPVHGPSVYGPVEGLPAPMDATIYVVSLMVAARCPERADVVAPGTGPLDGAIRHPDGPQKGQIAAVTRLVRG